MVEFFSGVVVINIEEFYCILFSDSSNNNGRRSRFSSDRIVPTFMNKDLSNGVPEGCFWVRTITVAGDIDSRSLTHFSPIVRGE